VIIILNNHKIYWVCLKYNKYMCRINRIINKVIPVGNKMVLSEISNKWIGIINKT
jgi:hypothetical protein